MNKRKMVKREKETFVLVYGEDRFDTLAIKELLVGLHPELNGRVRALKEPPIEVKHAAIGDLPRRADRLAAAVAVEQVRRDVRCVFAHEDCDAVEPAHKALTKRIESALASMDVPVFGVTPAWEMEAWWFQWPDAVQATNPSWRRPDRYVGRDVGRVRNAKERLKAEVVPNGLTKRARATFRTYSASDAPAIARSVRERALTTSRRPERGRAH